ncbi:MAG: TAT-variant-translocated molybdopterin oxidoreductase [Vicinamibacterales bacterium]
MSSPPNANSSMDFGVIRSRLASTHGRLYWRSLGELGDTPEFREYLHREFPEQASEWNDPKGRRDFLKLMSASLALAGVGACTKQPPEDIVPYVRQPEEMIPGRPLFFASAIPMSGVAMPVLVESHMGRPTKIEGNPEHPASLGATDVFTQAAVLDLYDPDRAQTITYRGDVRPWSAFLTAASNALNAQRARQGAGLRFLTPPITSPSLAEMMTNILRDLPQARWHQFDAVSRPGAAADASAQTVYHFDRADVVVALDADFLACGPGSVRYSREFADRRRVMDDRKEMNRLYAVESTPTLTGAKADHRLPLAASDIESFARQLAAAVGAGATGNTQTQASGSQSQDVGKWIAVIAKDLQVHRGRSVVVAGDYQTAAVHTLARSINEALGNIGTTVTYSAGTEAGGAGTIAELAQAMDAGQVELLVISGVNPVFTAPADLRFGEKLAKVALAIYHGFFVDDTANLCHWNIPEAHALETWGDARAFDGTVTLSQPLIAPLYEGRSLHEVVGAFTGQPNRRALEIVRDYWSRAHGAGIGGWTLRDPQGEPFRSTDAFWRRSVHDGLIWGTGTATAAAAGATAQEGTPAGGAAAGAPGRTLDLPTRRTDASTQSGLEIIFRPDPTIWDGRFANNGWLQELPKPLTRVTWDPTAWVAPRLAEQHNLRNGDLIDLRYRGATARLPVFIVPGHPAQSVTVFFGYGQRQAGRVAKAVGTAEQFNVFPLRTSDAPWFGRGLEISKAGDHYPISSTQEHHLMEGRAPVRVATLATYKATPAVIHGMGHTPPRSLTLYPEHEYHGYKWGMAIDLTSCTGCGACTVACVAENNIPVVGKTQVGRGREMHWIRVDHYFTGEDLDNPQAVHQPVPCMQCENAPCEVVCPVAATTHSSEGLNDMVYNRCVGTRYCSNNCPYKVRRFNFLLYADWNTQSEYGQKNPDVTVRSRGVMEKCTYCVQRINQARIDAKREDRKIRDGEVVTACQAVCPADAIVFGDLNDPNSQVNKVKAQERNYGVLEELNTRPRTTYLAALRNPNPELEPAAAGESAGHTTGH